MWHCVLHLFSVLCLVISDSFSLCDSLLYSGTSTVSFKNCYRSCLWDNYFLPDNSHSTSPITKWFKVANNLKESAKQFLWWGIWLDEHVASLDCLTCHFCCLSHAKISYPAGVAPTQTCSLCQCNFPASFQIRYVTG